LQLSANFNSKIQVTCNFQQIFTQKPAFYFQKFQQLAISNKCLLKNQNLPPHIPQTLTWIIEKVAVQGARL
jgi:hypothetical protein